MKHPSNLSSNEPPNERPDNGSNLTPGLKPGQERGPDGKVRRKADPDEYGEPAGDPTVPAQLRAMRLVMTQPKSADRTQWEKVCRAYRDRKPDEFLKEMRELEAS